MSSQETLWNWDLLHSELTSQKYQHNIGTTTAYIIAINLSLRISSDSKTKINVS